MSIEGKVAVVTGAARGIGYAYVERLLKDGANIVSVDIDDPNPGLSQLEGSGERLGLACDLSDPEQVQVLIEKTLAKFGRVDILVNNAGIFPTTSLDSVTMDDWRRVQSINVEPILALSQGFAPGMITAGWGRIVNTGSANTLLGGKDLAYLTSKAAVHGLTRALANELGEHGITVNAIAPSIVATEGFLGRDRRGGPHADEIFARVSGLQTIKRASVPTDLSNALAFLVSDAADFITGQIIHVDGGLTRTGA